MTVISANSEILSLTYGENEWCNGIERQTKTMRSLINKMIQMSKLDEGNQLLQFEVFNISEAIYDTVMSFAALTEVKGLQLSTAIQPELYIKGDEGTIRQVISILMDNAVKYCDAAGSIDVITQRISRRFGKGRICFSITNTFSSVQTLNTERLFDRFYREDKARTSNHSYGLGLAIAKSIVEYHGGLIEVKKLSNAIQFTVVFNRRIN